MSGIRTLVGIPSQCSFHGVLVRGVEPLARIPERKLRAPAQRLVV